MQETVQEPRKLAGIVRLIECHENTLALIESVDFDENRLAFTLIMRAARDHCAIRARALEIALDVSPSLLEMYIDGRSAPNSRLRTEEHLIRPRTPLVQNALVPLITRKLARLKAIRERAARQMEENYGLEITLPESGIGGTVVKKARH